MKPKRVNIQAAKTHLSRLVEEAAAGADIVLAKAGKPMVRLVPVHGKGTPRTAGILAAEGWESPDCWSGGDDPLGDSAKGSLFHGTVEEPPRNPPT